jgi:2-polyprenyl-6-methoxyphenol hydroxylase-like FAD-dependent oxidoreductase
MAAITLATLGYDVNVYEARPESDLHSDGILGITNANWDAMTAAGVNLGLELTDNSYMDTRTGEMTTSPYHYITWTDLHNALHLRAVELFAKFHYGERVDITEISRKNNVTVVATGIGSAKEVSQPDYTGYVVIRGLAYQFSGAAWTALYSLTGAAKPWNLMVGDTRDGASVTFFVQRSQVQQRTTYSAVAPGEVKELPERWQRLLATVPLWQQAPLSDWDVPAKMVYPGHVIRIGDSNGQMRPQTSNGANLGLNEAMRVYDALTDGRTESALIAQREQTYYKGRMSPIA